MHDLRNTILNYSFEEAVKAYAPVIRKNKASELAWLGRNDRFFLLTCILDRKDALTPWIYERCREVEKDPDGYLDLWSRFHYKSTIITYAGIIQELVKNPNITIGIFSKTNPIAKKFLEQIKETLEKNELLKWCYSDCFYQNPRKESSKWSVENGFNIRRSQVKKEASVSAHGVLDAMPTGAHFDLCVYDDVIDMDAVTTPDMIAKVTERWSISLALANDKAPRRWHVGTRYHLFDTYKEMMDRGAVKPRIRLCQDDAGNPTLLTPDNLADIRRNMGPRVFACQMLQNPVAEGQAYFSQAWLCFTTKIPDAAVRNVYILVDPAHSKKAEADSSVFEVWAACSDGNYYLVDGVRDKLNLTQRADTLFRLVRKWKPICVGYERYGLEADVQHIQYRMNEENYHFRIVELGGSTPKPDRIGRLIPLLEQGKIWLYAAILYMDAEGRTRNFIDEFIRLEYSCYPVAQHDDMLDCAARILDEKLGAVFPSEEKARLVRPDSGGKVVATGTGFDPLAF